MWLEYSRRVAAGLLVADSVQALAAEALSRLSAACADATTSASAAAAEASRRHHAQQNQPPAAPLRGVYMHGGVGRGKTMLMDIFHDALPEPAEDTMPDS